jgi:hypothetical protein
MFHFVVDAAESKLEHFQLKRRLREGWEPIGKVPKGCKNLW